MTDTLLPADLVEFLLFDWLDLTATLERPQFADLDRESVQALLGLADRLARDAFLPHYKAADRHEPSLTPDGDVHVLPEAGVALRAYVDAGFMAAPFSAALGGLNLPEVVQMAATGSFMAANLATAGYALLTVANARLVAHHGTPAQIDAFVMPQLDGRAFGTMCLSEPQAGSSLADVRTRAVPDGAGSEGDALGPRFRVTGNKMWISGGDQDLSETIHHLVLAKIPGPDGALPEGTRGLSLFLVPKHLAGGARNDVVVAGLNHKMGYRGTSNCLLNFGEGTRFRPGGQAGAIGYLVGKPGHGLAIMFHMMNEARIGVGLGAAAVALRAHALSVDYAQTRLQGRTDPAGPPVPIARHPDIARQLTRQRAYAEAALSFILFCARLVDDRDTAAAPEDRARADALLGLMTPAAKTWASEWGLEANSIAIQIFGGYGYTRDFDVEQLYRDNRLNPIHEGTTGIQGIDFVGRKLLKEGGAGIDLLAERIAATVEGASGAGLGDEGSGLAAAWARFLDVRQALPGIPRNVWLGCATEVLDGFGHVVAAWMLLDQALVAHRGDRPAWAAERRVLAQYFITADLPRAYRAFDLALRPPAPLLDFTVG